MRDATIREQLGRPLCSRIAWVHVEPHGVDREPGVRSSSQQVLLRPPGGRNTGGSGWRQQQEHADFLCVLIEGCLQLRDRREIAQRRCGRSLRSSGTRCTQLAESGRQRERRAECRPSAKTADHQPPGFRGTACVATVGHATLIAVTHMLPRKVLWLFGDD